MSIGQQRNGPEKVLMVSYVNISEYHGLANRMRGFVEGYKKSGILCFIICPKKRGAKSHTYAGIREINPESSLLQSGARIRFILGIVLFNIKSLIWTILLSRRLSIRIVQFEQIFLFPAALITRLIMKKRVIIDDLNLLQFDYRFLPRKVLQFIDYLALRSANLISSASLTTLRAAKESRLPIRVLYVPNGVCEKNCIPSSSLALKRDQRAIFVGSMGFHQNVMAVRTLAAISDRIADTPLSIDIVGGPLDCIDEQIRTASRDKFRVRGPVSDVELRNLYLTSRIGLLPFFDDTPMVGGQRTKALDYFSSELLVVSGPQGIGELDGVLPGEHYILAESREDFVKVLETAGKNPQAYEEIRRRGCQTVTQKYTWFEVIDPLAKEIRTEYKRRDHRLKEKLDAGR